ncbi:MULTISPECIES: FimV/HubP family polar landmark protein [Halomonadaceae]|uniref:FimV/HubP family polar landmark protein n=1 Tax=Halomonadaceae TaxID=28256 RepID=UPI001583472F|nr:MULTISPECIES: FimV/HubP family polar landmark protein [Halomonas]MDI4637559.1 tetratricopeptide repeat protein [Halomonas sp. BMC7]NUJ58579.1 tetratricopeptide repeat protein [Halomonas taeanensis]
MNRKFSLVILLTSLSAMSPLAWSLGVGEAKVDSALGAPLEATLPLTDAQGISAQNLTVSLADADDYRRVGLERSLLVDALSLSVEPQSGGLAVRVQSSRAVRTPYLDLLVDISGPDVTLRHQVTLLFDPPGFGSQSATPTIPAAGSPQPEESPQLVESAQPDNRRQAEPTQTSVATRERGPGYVDSGETLWSVAERLRPDADISISQMMMALLDANPEAFPGGNINRLRAGYVLEVPSREQIASRSTEDAWQQVQAQNSAFARGEPAPEVASSTASQQAAGSADDTANAADRAADKPAQDNAGAAPGLVQAVDSLSQAAQTSAVQAVASPEVQPGTQRLTLLTDAQIESEVEAAMPDASEQNQRLDRLEARLSQSQQSLAAMREERDRAQAELASLREEVAKLRANLSALSERQAESVDQAASEPAATGLVERYLMPLWASLGQLGRSLYGQLAGVGLVVLLALWWLVRRRRAAAQAYATDQVSTSAASSVGEAQGARAGNASERFAPDAQDALMPRAEAVSEADIFIAYGRYEKAQALLEESLGAEPDRPDLRLKLVKVLVEQGQWQQAHAQAEHLSSDTDSARQAELERLMARERAVPTPSEAEASTGTDDADGEQQTPSAGDAEAPSSISLAPVEPTEAFRPPIEREPVAFDGKGRHARPSWQEGKEVAPEQISEALKSASNSGQDESAAGAASSAASGEPHSASPAEEAGVEEETGRDESERSTAHKPSERQADVSDTGKASPDESEPPESTNDHMIDYRPPTLEPEPAGHEETPMQPSVEFPPSQAPAADQHEVPFGGEEAPADDEDTDTPAVGEDAGSNLAELMRQADTPSRSSTFGVNEQELDIEEVAFEPLHLDNSWPADSPPKARALVSDAEALLEQGDHDQAQGLLARALEEGDSETREQASRLIAQHNL